MKLSKKLLLLCLLFGVFVLTGCGIQVSTDLTVDENFKGTRTISCYVSNQDMSLHFQGDSAKIDSILENHCPGCMEYVKEESSSGIKYIFTLRFSSLEDYRTQLGSVLNFSPQVEYKGINSFFSKSVDLEENFTSIDLLRWFEILLTDEYSITESQLEKLWDIKDTTVTWMDLNYTSAEDTIHISDHHYTAFDGISIYTTEKEDRTFVRRIQFSIPKETLDKKLIELEEKFEAIKPEGTTGIWTTTDTGKIYEMTFQAEDFETLSQKTGTALGTQVKDSVANVTISENQYLSLNLEYCETLDFSKFLSTENGEVPVTYYFRLNSMTEIDSEQIQKEINNSFVPKQYDEGYYKIYSGNCSSLKIRTLGTMQLPVSSYSIHTTLQKENQWKRELLFTFEDILCSKEKELLSSILKTNSNDTLSLKLMEDNKNCVLSITQTGTKDNLNYSSRLLFGDGNEMVSIRQHFLKKISPRKITELRDTVDLTAFLGNSAEGIQGTYTFQDNYSQTEDFYLKSETSEFTYTESQDSNERNAFITGSKFSVYYKGSNPSYTGLIILIVLMGLSAVSFYINKKYLNKEKVTKTRNREDQDE